MLQMCEKIELTSMEFIIDFPFAPMVPLNHLMHEEPLFFFFLI